MYMHLHEVRKSLAEKELRAIHARATAAVDRLKSCEADLIRCLQEVDAKLVYRFLGHGSLFQYAIQALRLTESQAWNFITVARKARQFPALQAAIETKELSISKARKLTPVLSEANQIEWVELAKQATCREIERTVAAHAPRAAVPERMRFIDENTLELQAPILEHSALILKRAQDLLSQSRGKAMNLDETIQAIGEFFLERKDPVRRAERAAKRAQAKKDSEEKSSEAMTVVTGASDEPVTGQENPEDKAGDHGRRRRALPARVQHEVHLRDQGRCQFRLANGEICGERRWVDLHHRVPVAGGGGDSVENLVTICRSHQGAVHAGVRWSEAPRSSLDL
ncbi:MAG: HNH endonuclease [Bdellovibrionaceae bacterium]|nr:HNH endonuclease [Pseudobdellovibrionaceae bacterium]